MGELISAGGGGAELPTRAPHRLRPRRSVVLRVAQNDFVRWAAFGRKVPATFATPSKTERCSSRHAVVAATPRRRQFWRRPRPPSLGLTVRGPRFRGGETVPG